MNPLEPVSRQELLAHLATFESPLGRWRLQAYLTWKRLMWRGIINGTVALKRAVDIVGSLVAMVLFSPVFIVLALLIKLEDGGPIIFAQPRIGRYGRIYKMYKFRSMYPNAEQRLKDVLSLNHHAAGVSFKMKKDPRLTRIGGFIRKYSLDELPQFYNVLLGNMSLVGPRPSLLREFDLYRLSDHRRLLVKPGITCIWQISGRADIDFPEQVELDIRYIESSNLWQDIKLLFQTIPAILFGKGAY